MCIRDRQWHINVGILSAKTKHGARHGYFGVREWLDTRPCKLGLRSRPKPTLDAGRVCSHSGTKWRHEISFRFQPLVKSMNIIRTRTIIGGIISDIVFYPWSFHCMGPNRRITTRRGGNRFELSVYGVCNGISTWAAYLLKQNMARVMGISTLKSD